MSARAQTRSRVGGISVQAEAAANPFRFRNIAFTVAAFAVAALPAGFIISGLIDSQKNAAIAKDQRKVLANHFREQIAERLGKNPRSVTVNDLDLAAKIDPAFAQLVRKVNLDKERADRATALGVAGASTIGFIPGAGVIGHALGNTAGKVVTDVVGFTAGGLASGLLNRDKLEVHDLVTHIDAKVQEGMPIEAMDVMLLRIAQDESLQEQIKKMPGANNTPLHKMNDVQQRAVLAAMPELYDLAERDAQAVNAGRIKQQDLLVASPGQAQQAFGQHTARIQSRAGQGGDFRSRLNAQRAAAPAGGVVRS